MCGAVLLTAALVGPWRCYGGHHRAHRVRRRGSPSASVLRAAVMAASPCSRSCPAVDGRVPALSVSVIVAPELAVDVGLVSSVTADAALVVLAPAWSQRLVGRGWPKSLADAVAVALAAQVVTAPIWPACRAPVRGLRRPANLAVAAIIPPITVIGTGPPR